MLKQDYLFNYDGPPLTITVTWSSGDWEDSKTFLVTKDGIKEIVADND